MIIILAAGIFPLSLYLVRTMQGEKLREGHTLEVLVGWERLEAR